MRAKKLFTLSLFVIVASFASVAIYVLGSLKASADEELPYNRIVIISGKVTILNHPELGVTPFNNTYLVFQREDCKRCLVATWTDIDGKYKIYVGEGRYKIILHNPSPPTVDLLSPDQPRYINATNKLQENVFDIKVTLPKDK